MSVVIETTLGDFTVDLFTDERPQTCRNFLKLCKIKYYNWHLFHTVQSHFIAQTGDPTGTGKAGESIYGTILGEKARYYEGERMPKIKHDRVGLLSMVNCGDYMFGSQFIITLDKDLQSLDGEHCVFGEIVEGIDIILKFNEAICDGDHRPFQDIRISHTVILEDPFEDPENLPIPDKSPEPTKEFLLSDRIGADEILDDEAGLSMEEIIEMRKDKEAKAAATILEIVGDIPDADIAPPENVLFVCKLNPVTTDDDLEIIFSRFGRIVGCEVIRDRQTGDSLQYAFIEFAEQKSCEEAYLKMDNTLIDDRRIHVDFSQSVAKMRWRGKGKGFLYNDDKRANPNSERESSKKKRDTGDRRRRPQQHYNRDNDYDRDRRDDDQRKRSKRYDREGVDDDYDRDGEGRRRNRSQEEEYTSRHHYRDRKYNEKSRKEDRENDDNYNKDEEVKNRKKLRTGENKDRHRHHSREEREKSRKDDSGEEQNYSKDEERRHRRKIREEESTSRRRQDNDHERKDRERNRREAPGKDDDDNRDEAVRCRERLRQEEKKNRHHHENRRDRESRRERSRDRSNRRQYNESSKDKHKDKYARERTPNKKHREKSSKRTHRD